jgi:hypothetical protein
MFAEEIGAGAQKMVDSDNQILREVKKTKQG